MIVKPGLLLLAGLLLGSCAKDESSDGGNGNPPPGQDDSLPDGEVKYRSHGNEKGNGGDVVVCFKSEAEAVAATEEATTTEVNPFSKLAIWEKVQSLSLLDLVEYTLPTGLPPTEKNLMEISENHLDALPKIVERLSQKSGLGVRMSAELEKVPLSNWKKSGGVVTIDDSNHPFFLPSQCLLVQAAVRQDGFVFYDGFIFDHLSERNKLGLILHEVIYSISGQTSSQDARKIVGLALSADEWEQSSPVDIYRKLLPIGNFALPVEIQAAKTWATIENWSSVKKISLVPAIPMKWGIVSADINELISNTLESFLAGKYQSANGNLTAPMTAGPGQISLNGETATGYSFTNRGSVNYGGFQLGSVMNLYFGTSLVIGDANSSTTVATPYGQVYLRGPFQGTADALTNGQINGTVTTPFGSVCLKGAATLDASGMVQYASEVSKYDFSCQDSSDDVNESLTFGVVSVYINRSQFWFNPNGTISQISKSKSPNPVALKISSDLFSFENVEQIEFDSQSRVRKVTTGTFGKYRHKTATNNEVRDVGAAVIVLDENGNP